LGGPASPIATHADSGAPPTMPRTLTLLFILGFSATVASAAPPEPCDLVGTKIDNLRLQTLDGKMLRLHDLADRKAVVVVFVSFDCPVSNDYLGSLIELYQAHKERVSFLAVAPTTDSVEELQNQAREYKVPFPVVRDDRLHVADALAARTTPEVM